MFVSSEDGARLRVEVTGRGETALLFVHGWMGNARWWDAQRDTFSPTHEVLAVDLGGHGASSWRARPTAQAYAADIVAAARASTASRIVLVAHSMAGVYALVAAPAIDRLERIVTVDTLKNLDQLPSPAQSTATLASYRADYRGAVETLLPQYLYTPQTPPAVVERLGREFLAVSGEVAASLVEPLYHVDIHAAARAIRVPVRGIGGDVDPAAVEINRAYFADYAYTTLAGCGHYPMLERPAEFDAALAAWL